MAHETAPGCHHRRRQAEAVLAVTASARRQSAFLAQAGYRQDNAGHLLRDLRTQLLPLEAQRLESNTFGQYYEIRGTLSGPNGVTLAVRTIWLTEHLSGVTKFVTLIPDKRRTE